MATRSAIALAQAGKVRGIYCHWDGYIDHNGAILHEHYDEAKTKQLIALGNVSSLRAEIGEQHPFSQFEIKEGEVYDEAKYENWCTFYGRDRGETRTKAKTFADADEFVAYFDGCGCEYFYLMHDGAWYVNAYGKGWVRLSDGLTDEMLNKEAA